MSNRKLSLLKLHPEFLQKYGRNEFVVLPYDEYVAIQEKLEDALDLMDLRKAMAEDDGRTGLSLRDVKKQLRLSKGPNHSKPRRKS